MEPCELLAYVFKRLTRGRKKYNPILIHTKNRDETKVYCDLVGADGVKRRYEVSVTVVD